MFRAAIAARDAARAGRSSRSSRAGELVPDELTVALIRERLAEADARRRASCSTASRATWRRPRRSTRCSREIGRGLDAILFFDLPDEVATERMLEARRRGEPPRRHARGDRRAARDLPRADGADRRALPGHRASSCRCTPSRHDRRGLAPRSRTALDQAGARRRDHPQERARDRADGRAGEPSSPARSRCSRSGSSRASRWPSSTGSPRSTSARRAACRPRRATRASRPRPASRRTTMIVHGIPGDYRAQRGRHRLASTSASRKDGLIADSAATFPRRRDLRRGAAPARRLPGGARGRHRGGAGSARSSATSRPPCRRSSRRRASRSCAASSATASAAPTTRIRRCRISSPPTAARSSREGMTLAIEPMITAGGPEVYVHDDELVDLDRRRLARGPFRAHRRDHRGRPARADEAAHRSWYHDRPRRRAVLFCVLNRL